MLEKLKNIQGIKTLEKSIQQEVYGGGSCQTGFFCNTDVDCPGFEYGGSQCINSRCHFF